MGSIISAVKSSYDDYTHLCEILDVTAISIYGGFCEGISYLTFFDHEKEILNKLGFKTTYEYFDALNKAKHRDTQINDILND